MLKPQKSLIAPFIEGPYGIGRSLGPYPDDPGLQAGMVISNEPGYYKPGEFGTYLHIWLNQRWLRYILKMTWIARAWPKSRFQ